MDLLYLPDSISFQARVYGYGREEQNWVNINQKPEKSKKNEKEKKCTTDERNCTICKSRQKRALSNYIQKARKDSDRGTCIEEEEEEEEGQSSQKEPNKKATEEMKAKQ